MPNDTTVLYTRVGGRLRDRFENWRRAQPVIPPRSEALRSLLNKALTAPSSDRTAPDRINDEGRP
jgi:hypothetical protein